LFSCISFPSFSFITQKNVTLSGLEGKVNVAEGLQISLDALNWANSIDLSKTED